MNKKLRAHYFQRITLAKDYSDYFENKMDKYDADELIDLDSTNEKKDFFNEVDEGWEAKQEQEQDVKDLIPGGLADELGNESFDPEQLEKGTQVELEHTDDEDIAKEISRDHLVENKIYYDELEKIDPHHASLQQPLKNNRAAAANRYLKKLLK